MSTDGASFLHLSPSQLSDSLAGPGLHVDYGACVVRMHSALRGFGPHFQTVYRWFPHTPSTPFADFHVRLAGGRGPRRWLRPQARFRIDAVEPFEPFPLADALPLYEWGVNWCFAQRFNQHVLLHAAALAIGDRAVVMPATPGSGKSTLSAALMLRGLRLLSDEFGVLDPQTGLLLPMLKPVALKERSIDVIGAFSADTCFGPTFVGTRKGRVAHLAPDAASVAARHSAAHPRLVVFPAYREGAALSLLSQPKELAFARLAFNSFNYAMLGPVAFEAVADLAEHCAAFQLTYGRLEEAVDCITELLGDGRAASAP